MINLDLIIKASYIKRFSGNFICQDENIMSHSAEMALLCINFAELVPESNAKEMTYRCILHDIEEIAIGADVPRPMKYYSEELKELIDKSSIKILSEYIDNKVLIDSRDAKDSSNINGFLVGLADRIQCFIKMSKEVKLFNNNSLKSDLDKFNDIIHSWIDSIYNLNISESSKINLSKYILKITNYF